MYSKLSNISISSYLRFNKLLVCFLMGILQLPAQGSDKIDYQLEPVAITSEKVETTDTEVPASISVLQKDEIESRSIDTISDLQKSVPGLSMGDIGGSGSAIMIRNIGGNALFGNSPVAFYIDGIPYLSSYSISNNLWDLESIEVLKGPQGTLYGRGSLAGVINIQTVDPSNETVYNTKLDYFTYSEEAEYQSFRTSHGLSLPIIDDSLFLRIHGYYQGNGGFLENITKGRPDGDNEVYGGGLKLVGILSDDFTWKWALNGSREKGDQYVYVNNDVEDEFYSTGNEDQAFTHDRMTTGLTFEKERDNLKIVSQTSLNYSSVDIKNQENDYTANAYVTGSLYKKDTVFNEELRIQSLGNSGSPLTWVGGLFGNVATFKEDRLTDGTYAGFYNDSDYVIDITGWAAFGQLKWDLSELNTASYNVNLTLGARYETEKNETKGTTSAWMLNADTGLKMPYQFGKSQSETYDAFLPKVALSLQFDDYLNLYGSVSRGFKAGGVNHLETNAQDILYEPEFSWNYEIGAKGFVFEKRLKYSISGFFIDYTNYQVSSFSAASGGMSYKIDNLKEVSTWGTEIEFTAKPFEGAFEGLMINGSLAYIPMRFDNATFVNSSGTSVDATNNRLPYASDLTGNIGLEYQRKDSKDTADNYVIPFIRIESSYRSEFFSDEANTLSRRQDDFWLSDAKFGIKSDTFDVSFWIKNLFDQRYHTYAFQFFGDTFSPGKPRSIGVSVSARF